MESRAVLLVVLAVFGLAACERPAVDEDEHPLETMEPAFAEARQCSNPTDGYTVDYPADWHTNEGDGMPPCSLYSPTALADAADDPRMLSVAVYLRVEPVRYERIAESSDHEQLEREDVLIADRAGERVERRGTGEGGLPEDVLEYGYYLPLADDVTFVATTHDAGSLDYQRKREVLDDMMTSLRFDDRWRQSIREDDASAADGG